VPIPASSENGIGVEGEEGQLKRKESGLMEGTKENKERI
jgi:hypothetical protein